MKISLLICALFVAPCYGAGDNLAKNDLAIPTGVETPEVYDSYDDDDEEDEQFLITGEKPKVTISSISPAHGPVTGDTRVTVRGGPFAGYQTLYPEPKCRFGSDEMVVSATYIKCPDTARKVYEKEAKKKERSQTCVQCESSPAMQDLESKPVAFTVSLDGDFSDVASSVEYYYYKTASVKAVKPTHGPKDGETTVQVWGDNFVDYGEETTCSFGVKAVPAKVHDNGYITCVSPQSDVVKVGMPFSISLNGQQNTKDRIDFWYYNDPQVTVVEPNMGPESGGTLLTLKGENYAPFDPNEDIDISNSTFCFFKTLGVFKRATVLNSTRLTCHAPASYYYRETPVEVTLNAADRTEDNTLYHYYKPPFLFDSEPRQGPVTGNTTVTVIGTNFTDTGNITCKFGHKVVSAKYKSNSEILCSSPPVDEPGYVDLSISMYEGLDSSTVDYLYYNTPEVSNILPVSGPDHGFTQIAVMGDNFVDLGGDQAVCVFNKSVKTNATVINQHLIYCDSPSMLNKQGFSTVSEDHESFYNLQVSIDGGLETSPGSAKFSYYKKPFVTSVEPPLGPVTGGTKVTVHGKGFQQQAVSKRVVRIGHMQVEPDSWTNDTMTFTAPHVAVESTAPVSISLNGQQFTQQAQVHDFEQEVTYDYYDVPYCSNYHPRRGPTNGGTPIYVMGSQYRLHRPHLNDRFWVRFVDGSGSPVHPETEVSDENFGFDDYHVVTPPVDGAAMTTMQVSLNNLDWHDCKDPTSNGGFEFYQTPHVTKVDPPYGHLQSRLEDAEPQIVTLSGTGFVDAGGDLKCRFGNAPGQYLYTQAHFESGEQIKCPVPPYTKPDVLFVEMTVNDESYTSDNKTYGFFDPFVVDAEPKLLSVDGTTMVNVTGIGFVNSGNTAVLYNNRSDPISCGDSCVKSARFIDKNTLETSSFPQDQVKYDAVGQSVMWDPVYIDATVTGTGFTQNQVEVFYYEDPAIAGVNIAESPANYQTQVLIAMDFKDNNMERIAQYAKPTCRFQNGQKVAYTQGILIDYPLSGSRQPKDLDTIHCKTPVWHLDGTEEAATLDVSINGQNYFHVSDFKFTYPLKLDRDVPMSGPEKVQTKVSLVGSGFRMNQRHTDFKWGIWATEACPNEEVADYTYYQQSFLGSISGGESLRAYKDEVGLPRVDSPLTEGGSYVQTYKNSKIFEKEGPGYLEVGFDEVFQKEPDFNGGGSVTIYNYLPAPVEFYTYRELFVQGIHPTAGLTKGGTQVSVIGGWFKYMPEYGIVPHCKFGDKIVRAYFDSTVRLICESPPSDHYGERRNLAENAFSFSVSLNGVDWDSGNTDLQFSYYEEPVMHDIYPDMGNVLGGDEIFIRGEKFTNITDPEHFRCRFTPENLQIPAKTVRAHYINQTHIMCPSPGGWTEADKVILAVTWNGVDYDSHNFEYSFYSIHRALPRSGPASGKGGDILIQGEGFRADTNPKCLLNKTIYEPVSVTPNEIRCPMVAAQQGDDYFGNVDLSVTANGIKWDPFDGGFQYYEQPTVEDIDPKMGPNEGIGIINFYGSNFRADYPLAELGCKIGESTGKAYYVSIRQVKCVVEDLPLLTEEQDAMPAQVSLNSYSYTEPTEDTYYRPYGVQTIQPNSGPVSGYSTVIVQGQGFVTVEGVTPRCRFGTSANFGIVEAQIMSYTRLACRVPETLVDSTGMTAMPRDFPFSIALSGDEFDPWTQSSHKFRLYRQPGLGSVDPVEAAVGNVMPVFVTVADDSEFSEPMPPAQVLQMDNRVVSVEDNEQSHSEPTVIKCKFGRFGESAGVLVNDTTVMCTTPVNDESPDDVYRETINIAVAMNGVDFEESEYSPEFTFVGTAPYLSFTAILLTLLAVGFVLFAFARYVDTSSTNMPDRRQAYSGGVQNQNPSIPPRASSAAIRNPVN